MSNLLRHLASRFLADEFQTKKGYIRIDTFTAPVAAGNTGILGATTQPTSGTTTVTTGITNPATPRVVRVVGNQGTCTGNLTINGTDMRGNTVADVIAINGTTPVDGVRAFKTITSVIVPTRGAASDSITLGPGAALGLSRIMNADLGLKGTVDGTHEATKPTFGYNASDVSQCTVVFNTTPNGVKNFKAVYISTELYAGA